MSSRILLFCLCLGLAAVVPELYSADGDGKKSAAAVKKAPRSKKPAKPVFPVSEFDKKLLSEFDLPDKCPKLDDEQNDWLTDKYDDLAELYDGIKELYSKKKELQEVEDERELRHNQGKIRKVEGRIRRTKIALARKVKQRYRPLQRKLAGQLEYKKKYEARLAEMEASGNKRLMKKLNHDYEAKGVDLEKVQRRLDVMYYLLYWDFEKGGKK